MSKPVVAIVGRPNVGKSTLFNALAGEKIAIVKDTPGVTRDRIYAEVNWLDKEFTLIDTGGIEPDSRDVILSQMREQAQIAIDTAVVILFMTDVKQGLVDSDSKVADMLRRSHKPVILVVNKVDNFNKMMPDVYEFYNLGIGDPVPISASERIGIGDMLDKVLAYFPEGAGQEEEDDRPRVAIVGKPNVGKSSMYVSALTGQRLPKLFDMIDTVIENQTLRVATGVLNEIMTEAVAMQQPPSDKGKRLKLYYITQVAVKPPTFVIFVNDKELMHFSYTRYLENKIREAFGFRGTSLKFFIRERKEKDK